MTPVAHTGLRDPTATGCTAEPAGRGSTSKLSTRLPTRASFYRQVVESTHEGVWVADLNGTSVYANQRMAEMLGCSVASIVGKSVLNFVFAEDRSAVRERLEGYLKKPSGTREQERLRRADGSELWTLVSASVLHGSDRKPAGFLGMFTDISDHKQTQDALEARVGERTAELEASHKALAENELKFRRLFETIADAAFIFDGETRQVLEANDAALRLYGYSRTEFLKLRQPELTAEPEETENIIQLIIAGATPRIPLRYHKRRDGTVFPVEISAGCFVLRGRTLVCGVVRDITTRKTAEEALQRREQELSDFFADAPFGLMWVAPGGRIQRVNQAQLAILGCSGEAVYGQPIAQFHPEPSEATELLRRLARGETIRECRSRLRRPDGSIREILIDANGLWEGGSLVHSRWFVRDITQNLNLEREVLEISERERQRIGQNLHDDLCQQLVGIEFLSQRLVSRLAADEPASAQAAEISTMVKSALAQGRELAHGLSPVAIQAEGLAEALRGLATRTRHVFQVDCRFRNPGKPVVQDPMVAGNLYRIAQEAITNALKHGKARQIEVRLTRNRAGLRLCVRDDGVGLRPGIARTAGTGISIMRHRAETMSGSLLVDSSPGQGTRVTCLVPENMALNRQDL